MNEEQVQDLAGTLPRSFRVISRFVGGVGLLGAAVMLIGGIALAVTGRSVIPTWATFGGAGLLFLTIAPLYWLNAHYGRRFIAAAIQQGFGQDAAAVAWRDYFWGPD